MKWKNVFVYLSFFVQIFCDTTKNKVEKRTKRKVYYFWKLTVLIWNAPWLALFINAHNEKFSSFLHAKILIFLLLSFYHTILEFMSLAVPRKKINIARSWLILTWNIIFVLANKIVEGEVCIPRAQNKKICSERRSKKIPCACIFILEDIFHLFSLLFLYMPIPLSFSHSFTFLCISLLCACSAETFITICFVYFSILTRKK